MYALLAAPRALLCCLAQLVQFLVLVFNRVIVMGQTAVQQGVGDG